MNTKAFTLAIIIAGIVMWMVHTYIQSQLNSYIQMYGTSSSVVIAKVDIGEFDLIDHSKITITKYPEKFLAPGRFKDVKELENTIATVPIAKGEQITRPRVTYPGAKTGLARQVSVGRRAFTLLVRDDTAVGKLIKPGDRVDIACLIDYASGNKEMMKVQTVLQDVLVLSTGRSVTNSLPLIGLKNQNDEVKKLNLNTYENYNTITLELEPYQAQKMTFLIHGLNAFPVLTLRNNSDKERPEPPPTTIYDVLNDKGEARAFFQQKAAR